MHDPAKHDVRHLRKLALYRGPDVWVIVAVTSGPPGGNAVYELAAVGQYDAGAIRARDRKRGPHSFHLRIR